MQTPFNIIKTTPLNDMSSVDINQIIDIKFSHEINTKSIENNIFILKNSNNLEFDRNSFDIDLFEKVKSKKTYDNQTIFLKPINQLDKNTEYIIYVTDQVQNTIDDYLFKSLIVSFKTSHEHEYKAPKIISPEYGQIIKNDKPMIKFYNLDSIPEAYEIVVSSDKEFRNIMTKEVVENSYTDVISYEIEDYLKEGNYYFKVKAINGLYSETVQFFSKPNSTESTYLGNENEFDVSEEIVTVDEIRLIETFPNDNFSNVSTNVNIIYFKFIGKVTFDLFDTNNSNITGSLIDMNDLYDGQTDHGEVQGTWEIVYDERTNHSYVIYKLSEVV